MTVVTAFISPQATARGSYSYAFVNWSILLPFSQISKGVRLELVYIYIYIFRLLGISHFLIRNFSGLPLCLIHKQSLLHSPRYFPQLLAPLLHHLSSLSFRYQWHLCAILIQPTLKCRLLFVSMSPTHKICST